MTVMKLEDSSAEAAPTEEPRPVSSGRNGALRLAVTLIVAGVVWFVTWLAISQTVSLGTWALGFIIPSASAILFVLVILRQEQTWVWPVRRMCRLVPLIRNGELPIDALSEIDGGVKDLSLHLQTLLRDLRTQKLEIAELNAEMKQRVASRTDALERTIGSLRQQAVRDSLTGLFNRRLLDQRLPQMIEKCRLEKADLALLMIDVDYFKTLNDTLGHAAGDELLRNIGQIIRSTIRENDEAFRCGGDEFVIIVPGCDRHQADALAKRVNSLVVLLTDTLHLKPQPVLSIGVATIEELSNPTQQHLLELADKRLYEIKSTRAPTRLSA